MPVWHALVLGILQGLTEFFPISSSGHLALAPWLFGWNDFGGDDSLHKAFDVALHLGTLVGAAAYLWPDVVKYVRAAFAPVLERTPLSRDGRTAWPLLLSTVPAALVGALFNDTIDELDDVIWLIGVMLIVFGIVLYLVDRLPGGREQEDFRVRDAVLMGAGQALALQPGVSRSGVTMTVARWLRFDREAAARLSFLMALPVIAGAGVYSLVDVMASGIPSELYGPFAVGMLASSVTGWVAVWGTLRIVRTWSFFPFVVYRVTLGALVLATLASSFR
jgi:undecaprenyl-diphosphatase